MRWRSSGSAGGGAKDGADARQSGDVRDSCRSVTTPQHATRDDGAGIFGYPEVGALDVRVAVDEGGQQVGAVQVDGLAGPVAAAKTGDAPIEDDDIRLFDLGGEGVDDAAVGEKEVAGSVAASDGDEVGRRSPAESRRALDDADVGQMAVLLGEVEAVADEPAFADLEADVVDESPPRAARDFSRTRRVQTRRLAGCRSAT